MGEKKSVLKACAIQMKSKELTPKLKANKRPRGMLRKTYGVARQSLSQ